MNAIELKEVSKSFRSFSVNNLNIKVPEGYITGFIGPNGSGKSTTIHMMMDVLKADEGTIRLYDAPNDQVDVKQRIGFVYDELYMYENFTINNMKSFIKPLYKDWNEELFYQYLNKFNLPYKIKIKEFSKGMKMKCSLLFALAHDPDLIIMDEPTAGLDPVFRRELIDLLQELMVKENRTIFFSTHITTDLDRIADYIVFINRGKVILQKSMEEIRDYYHVVKGKKEWLDPDVKRMFRGIQENEQGFTGLFEGDISLFNDFESEIVIEQATLEDIMYFMTKF
ncbi:ABC transporter ATP-binding protein [Radiobacillus sp. PE A8.2]|uniref:ABC transporter ATP-binding protein n=1 Tax=Radiobacillus sp. PE A8.2 TaxID=3380349 RepID=UPI00388E610E